MTIKAIRKFETENNGIRCCFIEAKKKKAMITLDSCIAEMETSEEGNEVYLLCEWMDSEPCELYFEASKESIYDFLTFERNDIEILEDIRENLLDECFDIDEALESRFKDEYLAMMDLVREAISSKGYDISFMEV